MTDTDEDDPHQTLDTYRRTRVTYFIECLYRTTKYIGSRTPRLAPLVKVGLEEIDLLENMLDLLWPYLSDTDKLAIVASLAKMNTARTRAWVLVDNGVALTTAAKDYRESQSRYAELHSAIKDYLIRLWGTYREELRTRTSMYPSSG